MALETIKAGSLEVAYMVAGPNDGWSCVMCDGFPYDPHAFAEAAPRLAAAGARVTIPICAVTVRRAFSLATHRARASRRHSLAI